MISYIWSINKGPCTYMAPFLKKNASKPPPLSPAHTSMMLLTYCLKHKSLKCGNSLMNPSFKFNQLQPYTFEVALFTSM